MKRAIIPGSLAAISQKSNMSLAEHFLSLDVLLIVDMSGSMTARDTADKRQRCEVAQDELKRLQAEMPGKIGVVAFSHRVEFCPSGIPTPFFESTDMVKALQFVKPADGCGIRFVLISDGLPDDEAETLRVAKTFKSKIDVVYIGPEKDVWGGRGFLQRLAASTGGQYVKSEQVGMLAQPVKLLLAG